MGSHKANLRNRWKDHTSCNLITATRLAGANGKEQVLSVPFHCWVRRDLLPVKGFWNRKGHGNFARCSPSLFPHRSFVFHRPHKCMQLWLWQFCTCLQIQTFFWHKNIVITVRLYEQTFIGYWLVSPKQKYNDSWHAHYSNASNCTARTLRLSFSGPLGRLFTLGNNHFCYIFEWLALNGSASTSAIAFGAVTEMLLPVGTDTSGAGRVKSGENDCTTESEQSRYCSFFYSYS